MIDNMIPLTDTAPSIGHFLKEIENGLTKNMKNMKHLQSIEYEALVLEHKRLEAKYGSNHQRVKKLQSRINSGKALAVSLEKEMDRVANNIKNRSSKTTTADENTPDDSSSI